MADAIAQVLSLGVGVSGRTGGDRLRARRARHTSARRAAGVDGMRVRDSRRDWLGPDLVASLTPDEQRMIERYGGEDWLPLFPTTRKAVTAARAGAYAGRV